VLPFREIGSIKEHDCIRGRASRRILSARDAWIDDRRDGAIEIVDLPFGVDLTEQNAWACCDHESGKKKGTVNFHGSDLDSDAQDSSSDLSLNTELFWEGASEIRTSFWTGAKAEGGIRESR
jgi:hypothetical protein